MTEKVLVLLSHRWDATAQRLAEKWRPFGVRRMTPEDLSFPGWRLRVGGEGGEAMAVCAGSVLPVNQIAGVYSRMSRVYHDDIPHIVPEDRDYVADEMNAFLVAWLAAMHCPVLNRPEANSLSGPLWRQEQWLHAAARLGIPVVLLSRSVGHGEAGADDVAHSAEGMRTDRAVYVTVVGERIIGDGDDRLHGYARRLAHEVGVDLLTARFEGNVGAERLANVDMFPDVDEEVAGAVLAYFGS